jgi:AcrR family transcriptional regulator
MGRPARYEADDILDAVQRLVLENGVGGLTVSAIARASGAPVGSLYHRFGSLDELLAELWVRAARRSQVSFVAAVDAAASPLAAALAGAQSILDFAEHEPADARLLLSFRREDLIDAARRPPLTRSLRDLNRPIDVAVTTLAQGLFGAADRPAVERTLLAVFDIPHGAIRRHLIAGRRLPPQLCRQVSAAVRAVLEEQRGRDR